MERAQYRGYGKQDTRYRSSNIYSSVTILLLFQSLNRVNDIRSSLYKSTQPSKTYVSRSRGSAPVPPDRDEELSISVSASDVEPPASGLLSGRRRLWGQNVDIARRGKCQRKPISGSKMRIYVRPSVDDDVGTFDHEQLEIDSLEFAMKCSVAFRQKKPGIPSLWSISYNWKTFQIALEGDQFLEFKPVNRQVHNYTLSKVRRNERDQVPPPSCALDCKRIQSSQWKGRENKHIHFMEIGHNIGIASIVEHHVETTSVVAKEKHEKYWTSQSNLFGRGRLNARKNGPGRKKDWRSFPYKKLTKKHEQSKSQSCEAASLFSLRHLPYPFRSGIAANILRQHALSSVRSLLLANHNATWKLLRHSGPRKVRFEYNCDQTEAQLDDSIEGELLLWTDTVNTLEGNE